MTIQTTFTNPLSDFPNTKVNDAILEAEIVAAGLSVPLAASPYQQSGNAISIFDGLATSADETAYAAVVAAHQGADFSATPIEELVNAEASDDSGTEQQRALLESGPLPAGRYLITWYMQVSCTTAGGEASGRVTVAINGGAQQEADTGHDSDGKWETLSGSVSATATAGMTFDVRSLYQRTGSSGNAAKVRRCRLFISRLL